MTDTRSAYDPNRLPWLMDKAPPRRRSRSEWRPVLLWAFAAVILVAALGYWLGMRSIRRIESAASENLPASEPRLPAPPQAPQSTPSSAAPMTVSQPSPGPSVEPVPPPPPVRVSHSGPVDAPTPNPLAERPVPAARLVEPAIDPATAAQLVAAPPVVVPPQPVARPVAQRPATSLWPADRSEGAAGRAVRIGTYSSRLGAKRAWSRVVRAYPGMGRLKAVVVPVPSLRNGRTYYRLQFGTTSQAHSAVLCQRMRIIGQSCVVVGAPGA